MAAINFLMVPLALTLLIVPGAVLAQDKSNPPNNQKESLEKDWSKFSEISQKFVQGCVGNQILPQKQKIVRQNYCKCVLNAYQTRYTPEIFSKINTYVINIGKDSSTLVNLMMTPELNQCVAQTGYQPKSQ
jgi:hypothetical protein